MRYEKAAQYLGGDEFRDGVGFLHGISHRRRRRGGHEPVEEFLVRTSKRCLVTAFFFGRLNNSKKRYTNEQQVCSWRRPQCHYSVGERLRKQ